MLNYWLAVIIAVHKNMLLKWPRHYAKKMLQECDPFQSNAKQCLNMFEKVLFVALFCALVAVESVRDKTFRKLSKKVVLDTGLKFITYFLASNFEF